MFWLLIWSQVKGCILSINYKFQGSLKVFHVNLYVYLKYIIKKHQIEIEFKFNYPFRNYFIKSKFLQSTLLL